MTPGQAERLVLHPELHRNISSNWLVAISGAFGLLRPAGAKTVFGPGTSLMLARHASVGNFMGIRGTWRRFDVQAQDAALVMSMDAWDLQAVARAFPVSIAPWSVVVELSLGWSWEGLRHAKSGGDGFNMGAAAWLRYKIRNRLWLGVGLSGHRRGNRFQPLGRYGLEIPVAIELPL